MSDWVEARRCNWMHEAQLLKSVLEAAGIEADVPHEHAFGVQPFLSTMSGGIRLLVRAHDLERATEILDSAASAELPDDTEHPGEEG